MSNVIQNEADWPTTPDIAALQAMADPIIMVNKVLSEGSGNKRKEQVVINGGTNLDAMGIIGLQDKLPDTNIYTKGGPGTYRFTITDRGSSATVRWQVRLGGPDSDSPSATQPVVGRAAVNASGMPLPGVTRGPALPAPVAQVVQSVPYSADLENIGNGFMYHKVMKTLTLPDGRVFQWAPGQALPAEVNSLAVAAPTAPATAIGASVFGAAPAAGLPSPEMLEMRAQLAAMQAALTKAQEDTREQIRQRELEAEKAAHEKQLAALREANDRQMAELREAIKALSQKPDTNPELERLRAELESQRRANEAANADRKFDALANSIQALAAANANRGPDPMISTLTTLMTQQGAASSQQVQTMRDLFVSQIEAARAGSMTPDRLLGVVTDLVEKMNTGAGGVLNDKIIGALGGLLDLATKFQQSQGGDGGSPWLGVIERLVDQGGQAVSMIAQAAGRKAAAVTAQANAETVKAQAAVVMARTRAGQPAQQLPQQAAPTPLQAKASETPAPATPTDELEARRQALADAMDKGSQARPKTPEPAAAPAAAPAPAAPAPTPTAPATAAADAPAPTRRKRAKTNENPLTGLTLEELRETFDEVDDETFFGPFMTHIAGFRDDFIAHPEKFSPDDVAGSLFDAQPYFTQLLTETGTKTPPLAMDMLVHGRYDYLFERILPEADEEFWGQAAQAFAARMAAARAAQTNRR